MTALLITPIIIPLVTAATSLLCWNHRRVQRVLNLIGATAQLGAGLLLGITVWRDGIQVEQVGNWPAPFGISLVADVFSSTMVVLAALVAFAGSVYSWAGIDTCRESYGYYPLLQILMMGVCGAFLSGDLFNLYVCFEIMLMASFVLMALGGERAQLEGAIKYVTLNLLSSALFLAAIGILYGVTGTLNLADLSRHLSTMSHPGLVTTLATMFLIAFGIKAAAFPLFFWLPASYHTPPIVVPAIFSGLLTKVGVYALIRVFTLLCVQSTGFTHHLILIIAGLTMVTGVLGAVAQTDLRRLLSFHIVSQIGYLLMGLGLFSPMALAGTIVFMVHVILAKSSLFLVGGVIHRLGGTFDLKKLGGIYHTSPGLSVLFLLPALSLAGIPPLSGFWAKYILVRAGLEAEQFTITAVALAVSVLTLFSMIKIWNEVFWKRGVAIESDHDTGSVRRLVPAVIFLVAVLSLVSLLVEPVVSVGLRGAEQLLNPSEYVTAVMRGGF